MKCKGVEFSENSLDSLSDSMINASILYYNSNYYCSYRKDFLDTYFNPKNFLIVFDSQFRLIKHIPLTAEDGNTAFEDIRLFEYNKMILALYTYLPKNGSKWLWENGMGIAQVDLKSGKIFNQQSFRPLAKDIHEKNYTPLIHNQQLFIVTNIHPRLRILHLIGEVGSFSFNEVADLKTDFDEWRFGQIRGGTPFFNGLRKHGLWQYAFVHSSLYIPNGNFSSRYYMYTILRFHPKELLLEYVKTPLQYSQDETNITNQSRLLLKSKKNIAIKVVFPMGIIKCDEGVLISYGKDDCVTRLKFYSWQYIDQLFQNDTAKALG